MYIIVNCIGSVTFRDKKVLVKLVKHIFNSFHIFWTIRLLSKHYCWNVITSSVVKKEEGQLAFSTECSALNWVAVQAWNWKIFSLFKKKIIRIREIDLGEKSGRHLVESANLLIYNSEYQRWYPGSCLPVINVSRKQSTPFPVPEFKWKIGNLVPY